MVKGPKGRFQGLDDVTAAADFWGVLVLERASRDLIDLRNEWFLMPIAAGDRAVMICFF